MSELQNVTLSPLPVPQLQYCFAHRLSEIKTLGAQKTHIHDSYEIYVNVSGDVAFLVNNRLYPVEKGDVIVSRPGDVHFCIYQSQAPHEWFCFWLRCPEDSPLLAFSHREDFTNFIHFSDDTRRELLHLLHLLKDAQTEDRKLALTTYIFRVLTLFNEGEQTKSDFPSLPPPLQNVLDYINANFTQLYSTNDIVRATHVSQSTLNRWFRSYLQLSPHKYVEVLKLSYAQRLLLQGYSVTEVCSRSGFSSCSHFISVFRNKFKQTPLQYQKQKQQ